MYSRKCLRAQRPTSAATSASAPASPSVGEARVVPARPRPAKRRKLVQMHLDAGQADISASSCATCGMVYAAGAAGDDEVHRVHHAAYLHRRKVPFREVKGMLVLAETQKGKYLTVRTADSTAELRTMKAMDGFVTEQLGGRGDAFRLFGEGWRGSDLGWMAIVFVVEGEARGYLYAERVELAMEARVERDGVTVIEGKEVKRALCGVRKIWVKEDARRSGVGVGLIDVARTNLIYGHVVEAHDVAFTATTTSGGLLAASLAKKCGRDRILVYTG